jgi:phosphate transport system ATP-binding protein
MKIEAHEVHVHYGPEHVLKGVSMNIKKNTVTAFIGPSGCGKSTFLRCFNRMNDLIDTCKVEGQLLIDEVNILDKKINVHQLRKEVGMVFQKPNPFPKSIFENVAYGMKINGITNKSYIQDKVEASLKNAALWNEVSDKLKKSALALSGGQQQRLCIARALAVEPSILLMDEPASALDPISTTKIEELIFTLKSSLTIIIVTHNMQQATRTSDKTAFFYMGDLVEFDDTRTLFTNPKQERTQNYITGRFG